MLCYRFSGLTERDLGGRRYHPVCCVIGSVVSQRETCGVEGITLCVLYCRFSGLTERDLGGRRYHPVCIVL